MDPFGVIMPWLPAMLILILVSAFFSGSEAALFSLQASDQESLRLPNRSGQSALDRLLAHPERLLSAVLFWNLLINMGYFAIASLVGTRLESIGYSGFAIGFTFGSLLMIIFFSEMLPKSIAVKNAGWVSRLVAQPLEWALLVVSPVLPLLRFANLITQRVLWPGFQPEEELSIADIDRAIQLSAPDDALADRERSLLRKLVSLTDIRVVEWMRPRSQFTTHQFPISIDQLNDVRKEGYLYTGPSDSNEIDGVIAVRWLRPSHIDDLASVCEAPLIVPWSSSVATVYESLRIEQKKVAAVVNEYGETIGLLSVDDILESLLILRQQDSETSISENITVPGSMSVRELARVLQIDATIGKNVTVAGLVQSLRRRIPRLHDTCQWNGHTLTVCSESDDGSIEIMVSHEKEPEDIA